MLRFWKAIADSYKAIPPARRQAYWIVGIILLVLLSFTLAERPEAPAEETTITQFLKDARKGLVGSVEFSGSTITITYKDEHRTTFNGWLPDEMVTELVNQGVDMSTAKASPWGDVMRAMFSLLLVVPGILIAWHFLGGNSRLSLGGDPKLAQEADALRFGDIAGQPLAKQELIEIIDFLKDPTQFTRLGAKAPKGALMVGPPGVGKTLLARAVAGEAKAAFISCSGSDFRETYMGVGASKIRKLFREARKHGKCCIFIDEIEVLGRKRSGAGGGTRSEEEATLNALLVEMDGFSQAAATGFWTDLLKLFGLSKARIDHPAIVVLAATNRPDMIDDALMRPGRFDRHVHFDYPDTAGRLATLEVHARGKTLAPNVDLSAVAKRTTGMSGADLAKLLNEAAIRATRRHATAIGQEDLEAAYIDTRLGRAREGAVIHDDDRTMVAIHEAGHAVAAALVPGARKPDRATIIPRGRALGAVLSEALEEQKLVTKKRLMADLIVFLAGRAAEFIHAGADGITTGAEDDLNKATLISRKMAGSWSMLTDTPVLSISDESSPASRARVEETAQEILGKAWTQSLDLLKANAAGHRAVVAELLDQETIDGARIEQLLKEATAVVESQAA